MLHNKAHYEKGERLDQLLGKSHITYHISHIITGDRTMIHYAHKKPNAMLRHRNG